MKTQNIENDSYHEPWFFKRGFPSLSIFVFCLAMITGPSGRAEDKQTFSLNPKDAEDCKGQMNFIYSALWQYHKKYHKFPNRLSDLITKANVLSTPDQLNCPFVKRTGNIAGWRRDVGFDAFDDPLSTYGYEFSDKPHSLNTNLTWSAYKHEHMKIFGFSVPLVRCMAHRPRINLAYDGFVYESDLEWEDAFFQSRIQIDEFHNMMIEKLGVARVYPHALTMPRSLDRTDRQLNLAPFYNAPLFHLARLDPQGNLVRAYPRRAEWIGGVMFDVRGLIQLGAEGFPIAFPLEAPGVPVEERCTRMHFLHGTVCFDPASVFPISPGTTNATYVIEFDKGPQATFPIVYGKDVKTLWCDRNDEEELRNPAIAWVSPSDTAPIKRALRLYVTTWTNSLPARWIKSVSFRSEATNCAPFLVAITLE